MLMVSQTLWPCRLNDGVLQQLQLIIADVCGRSWLT